jgi:hypothetical protein
MHRNTKLTPAFRKEIFKAWKAGTHSQRQLAALYHVDKRVIGRVIERGKKGDFSVHDSTNLRYVRGKKAVKRAPSRKSKKTTK